MLRCPQWRPWWRDCRSTGCARLAERERQEQIGFLEPQAQMQKHMFLGTAQHIFDMSEELPESLQMEAALLAALNVLRGATPFERMPDFKEGKMVGDVNSHVLPAMMADNGRQEEQGL